ncbi:MAG: hypothetical protein MUE73_16185 [Planctomycetes bacterium]|nr:hypothetical protein [Planctomycetota bacterium]
MAGILAPEQHRLGDHLKGRREALLGGPGTPEVVVEGLLLLPAPAQPLLDDAMSHRHRVYPPAAIARSTCPRAIQHSARPGERVMDLSGRSGSTLIGAEKTGHQAFL